MLLVPEGIHNKIDMDVISAFSCRLIQSKRSYQFSKLRDLETDFPSSLCLKKKYNELTENNLLYSQIKIKTLLHDHCSFNITLVK